MISPALYWVMSADEFSLDINNPEAPKLLCIGNNPKLSGNLRSRFGTVQQPYH